MTEVEIALWKYIKISGPSWVLVTLMNTASQYYDFFIRFSFPSHVSLYCINVVFVGLDVFLGIGLCKTDKKN